MAPIVNSRKRSRSIENDYYLETQTKHFINEQMVNANNLDKMKQIHGKFNETKHYFIALSHALHWPI